MDARADAFVALPGGFGTLEELLEVLTLRQLRLHDRPIVLVNVAGYWDPFLSMVADMVDQGFAPLGEGALFQVAKTAAEAVDLAEAGPTPIPGAYDSRGAPVTRWRKPPSRTGPPSPTTDPAASTDPGRRRPAVPR